MLLAVAEPGAMKLMVREGSREADPVTLALEVDRETVPRRSYYHGLVIN